jgi:hypothetical protein
MKILLKEETKKFKAYDHTRIFDISPEKPQTFPKINLNRLIPKKEIIVNSTKDISVTNISIGLISLKKLCLF